MRPGSRRHQAPSRLVIVGDFTSPRNEAYRGTPVLAVEVRGDAIKRYLADKVQLDLEHDWTWV